MMEGTCKDHSGCIADIEHLENENKDQWEKINAISKRVDDIMTRLNVILGGVSVACVLLVINILIKFV